MSDLNRIGEFHRVVKNYTKMKKIEAMTNTTQIPASEVERWEREAEEKYQYYNGIDIGDLDSHGINCSKDGYIAGAKSEYLRRERWVSVKERLPEKSGEYLVAAPLSDKVLVTVLGYYGEWIDRQFGHIKETKVTHWMPLPSAPEPHSEP